MNDPSALKAVLPLVVLSRHPSARDRQSPPGDNRGMLLRDVMDVFLAGVEVWKEA